MPDTVQDPVVQIQLEWLTKVTGNAIKSEKHLEEMTQRIAGQELVDRELFFQREKMREDLMSVTVKVKGFLADKEMKILNGDGDYTKEIDTWHHVKQMTKGMPPETVKMIHEHLEKVIEVERKLKENPLYDAGGKSDDESTEDYEKRVSECNDRMAQDLWLPLVREGVIPENFVPQKYSAVVKQFEEASSYYDQRLQEYSKSMTEKDLLKEKFNLGFKIGKGVLKLCTAGSGLVGSVGEFTGDTGLGESVKEVEEVLGHLETALTVVEGVTNAALTDRDFSSVSDVMAGVIGDVVGAKFGSEVGGMLSAAVAAAGRAVRVGKLLAEGNVEDALKELGAAIAKGCAAIDKDGIGGLVGQGIEAGINGIIGGKKIGALIATGAPPSAIMNEILTQVESVANGVGKDAVDALSKQVQEEIEKRKKKEPSKEDDKKDSSEEDGKGEEEGDGDETDWANEQSAALAIINKKFDKRALAEKREEAAKLMAEDMEALRTQEDPNFEIAMLMGFAGVTDDDEAVNQEEAIREKSLDYILAVHKKNEATVNLCRSIATKGVGLVMKIFPGASLVEACMTLTFTIQDAIKKTEDMLMWLDNVSDSKKAVSPVVDAFLNRSGLANKQAIRAGIQVMLDAAKVVAEVLKLTPAAPFAPLVSSSASVAETTIDLLDIGYTEVQLANAWKVYQLAKKNPMDRYLARKATRENPTLSKYAMAWASLNGDAIAVEGMRRCGLTQETLAHPQSNVNKVVTYLETIYADDPQLLRAVPIDQAWYPPSGIALTYRSWMQFYTMATTKAEPLVSASGDISAISAAMGALDKAEAAFKTALENLETTNKKRPKDEVKQDPGSPDKAATDALIKALTDTHAACSRYKATDETGAPHAEMEEYVDALVARAAMRKTAVEDILKKAPWRNLGI